MPPSTASLSLADLLPGSHRVKKPLADGRIALHWYAWRGGPKILSVVGVSDADIMRQLAEAAPAAIARHKAERTAGDKITLYGLVTRYLVALDGMKGADRTKADRRKHLDVVRKELGALELKALESPRARKLLIDWRNRRAKTPKRADDLMGALSIVIAWAVDNAEVATNPVAGVAGLYDAPDRSFIVWTPEQMEIVRRHSEQPFIDFCEFMGNAGSRPGDARRLPRSVVGKDAVTYQTGKSNHRRTVVIPITDGLRAVVDRLPVSPNSTTLLNSSRQTPWTEAGVNSALQRAKAAARAEAQKRHGPKAKSGIEELRIYDLRGTACTNFMRWGMDDRDIADIMGWSLDDVREIRRRYVSGQEIGLAMLRRINANRKAASSD